MEPNRDIVASSIEVTSIFLDAWKNNTNQSIILEDISDLANIFDNKSGIYIETLPANKTTNIQKQIKARREGNNNFYNVLRTKFSNFSNSLIWKFLYTNTTKKLVTYLYLNSTQGSKLLKENTVDLTTFLKEKNLSTVKDKVLTFNVHGILDGDALSFSTINIYPEIAFVPIQTPKDSSNKKKSWLSKIFGNKNKE